jgi:hypothetical protein
LAGCPESENTNSEVKKDKWSREPKSLHDQMTLEEAKAGQGRAILQGKLNDPRYEGMQKYLHSNRTKNGNLSEVHYIKNEKTGELMDFKFKHHSTENVKGWTDDPAVSRGNL